MDSDSPSSSTTLPAKPVRQGILVPIRIVLTAALSVVDTISDMCVLVVWYVHKDHVWATISLVNISINTCFQMSIAMFWYDFQLLGVFVGLFQLTQVAEAVNALSKWSTGEKLTLNDRSSATLELVFEATPQTFLQLYVIVHQGMTQIPMLNLVSAAISFLSLATGLVAFVRAPGLREFQGQISFMQEISVVLYVFSDMILRVLGVCLFANAFRSRALPFLFLAFVGVAIINYKFSKYLIQALLIVPICMLSPAVPSDNQFGHERYLIRFATVCEVGFLVSVFAIPNQWSSSEPIEVKKAVVWTACASFIAKLMFTPIYMKAKYNTDRAVGVWIFSSGTDRRSLLYDSHHTWKQLEDTKNEIANTTPTFTVKK